MNRIVFKSVVSSDGVLHLTVLIGTAEANKEVQVTVEPLPSQSNGKRPMSARDLLNSGLVGMWSERTDIGDSREFARRLRDEAQTRRRN